MRFVLLVIALAAGCGEKRNPDKCLDGHCPDPSKPFCDEGGEISGDPGACVAVECTPGEFGACRGDRAVTCNNTGDNYDLVQCTYGCSDAAGGCNDCNTADCEKHIIPKYLPNICSMPSDTLALDYVSNTTIDTSNELNCGSVVAQVDAPELCVLHAGTITIATNETLKFYGSRVVALVADRELKVEGILDVGAELNNGPGGGFRASGGVPSSDNTGGGGEGFKTAGGHGATVSADGGNMNGGAPIQDPAQMVQLIGAPGRSSIGIEGAFLSPGGGGATLISCRGTVTVSGLIDANGGGGSGGFTADFVGAPARSAYGGGAGGYVVLQGMDIVVTGQLYANGGGGGSGQGPAIGIGGSNASGRLGQRGARAAGVPALGGVPQNGEGAGGSGGFGNTPPTDGKHPTTTANYQGAGAGGGSVGFFQTYVPVGTTPTLTPAAISPPFQQNRVIPTNR